MVQIQGMRKRILTSSLLTIGAIALFTPAATAQRSDPCIQTIQSGATITRDELKELLELSYGTAREQIINKLGNPYCRLRDQSATQGGVVFDVRREAYPFEFDPEHWLVVLYKDGRYLGYDYNFNR